jgi:hypothetical protein
MTATIGIEIGNIDNDTKFNQVITDLKGNRIKQPNSMGANSAE